MHTLSLCAVTNVATCIVAWLEMPQSEISPWNIVAEREVIMTFVYST